MAGAIRRAVERLKAMAGRSSVRTAEPPAPPSPLPAREASPRAAPAAVPKQAVIIVHGMGEQRPMDTLKGFVRTVWEEDRTVAAPGLPHPNRVWSKPDDRTGSLELRRITTRESVPTPAWEQGVRTDFYELYWADLTGGSTWEQFTTWVLRLLWRRWSRVPPDVRLAWIFLWVLAIAAAVFTIAGLLPESLWPKPIRGFHWLLVGVGAAIAGLAHKLATSTFGRVVRYTRADPDNIASRAAVRGRGLQLLRALHRGDEYCRVVLVAHSLGSILAHDLLSYFWAERRAARTIPVDDAAFPGLVEVERAAAALDAADDAARDAARATYRAAQTALRRHLAARAPEGDRRWMISDFVTLGSPLTHSEFLIASSNDDLLRRQAAREIPTAPPYREELDPAVFEAARLRGLPVKATAAKSALMCFPQPTRPNCLELHHAAPFAAVRWTNVYDPSHLVFWGDVIGGPLAATLGPAIKDIDLAEIRGPAKRFSHTHYWDWDADPRQLEAVRGAVNILDA